VPTPADGKANGEGQRMRLKDGSVGDGDGTLLADKSDEDDRAAAADDDGKDGDNKDVAAGDGGAVNFSK